MGQIYPFAMKLEDDLLYPHLPQELQIFWTKLALSYRFTQQEMRMLIEMGVDLTMWGENLFEVWEAIDCTRGKRAIFDDFFKHWDKLRKSEKVYVAFKEIVPVLPRAPVHYEKLLTACDSGEKISGMCPVSSTKTVCCNLRTLDVVQNCAFGCSYCSIQTFYSSGEKKILMETELRRKLKLLPSLMELDPHKFYHFGTGQSSDALLWGNANGLLDLLAEFAEKNPNVLLELKTKSVNIDALPRHLPKNIFCSWTLNTPTIVHFEEHETPALEARIDAARRAANRGIRVGFHFHPIVYYKGWREEYAAIVTTLQKRFSSAEIAYISLGTVTLIKSVIKELRLRGARDGFKSKILQMELVETAARGRLSYPEEMKIELFKTVYSYFSREWRELIYFYLCMESGRCWSEVFGDSMAVPVANEEFEATMCRALATALMFS
ncbi:MAG: DNA photolyase [Oligoflexia bacterium]|nr:DNA photolyase [Oligoflexia bacterium]MBF0365801.1 DNA photolyase [Oligoflexia bacterium]